MKKIKFIWSIALSLLALPLVNSQANIPVYSNDSSLLYWGAMDDASGVASDNKTRTDLGKFNLTPAGTLTYQQTALTNYSSYSINFDGDTSSFGNKSVLESMGTGGGTGLTFALWIKHIADADWENVVSTWDISQTIGQIMRETGSQNAFACTSIDNSAVEQNTLTYSHLYFFGVCIFNNTHLSFYANGTAVDKIAWTPSTLKPNINFTIGRQANPTASNFYNGQVDEVMIFNRSLGEAEIRYLMTYGINNTFPVSAPDTTPPIINGTANISLTNIKINDLVNFTFNWTDETAGSYGNITWNYTSKLFVNFSGLSGTSGQFSNTTKISCDAGCVINVTGFITDSSGNVKQNSTLFTVQAIPAPSIAKAINILKRGNVIGGREIIKVIS